MELKEKISKEEFLVLRAEAIISFEKSRATRKAALKHNGHVRYRLREWKKEQKPTNRVYHLALAFLRGRKYSEVERKAEYVPLEGVFKLLQYRVCGSFRATLKEELTKFFFENQNSEAA